MSEKGKTKLTQDEKIVLEHQLEEWKYLNAYVNEMDVGYQKVIVISISILSALTALITSNGTLEYVKFFLFLVPLGIVAVFAYLSYQFRITAILRGHLSALENDMNKALQKNVHMWNSALVEVFMAYNNTINQQMMTPIMVFIILLTAYCMFYTYKILGGVEFGLLIFIVYWIVVAVMAVIVFYPFLKNTNVRQESFKEEKVWEKYQEYLKGEELNCEKPYSYQKPKVNNKKKKDTLKHSVILALLNLVLGFGVLWIMSVVCTYDHGLSGLFDYYAATIGDGLFLSLFIGACYYYGQIVELHSSDKEYISKRIRFIPLLGCITGIIWQISWLLKKDIVLNWTIPEAGHFNLAGWYHAVYFALMFTIIPTLLVRAIMCNEKAKGQGQLAYSLMWCSLEGYWSMHLIDDCLTEDNYIGWLLLSAGIFFVLHILFFKDRDTYCFYLPIIFNCIQYLILIAYCCVGGLEWNVIECFEHFVQAINIKIPST